MDAADLLNAVHVNRTVQLHQRVVSDALAEATASYWERRARTFEDAAPRPGDWTGLATPGDLLAARERCLGAAAACRARASLEAAGAPVPPIVAELWEVGA